MATVRRAQRTRRRIKYQKSQGQKVKRGERKRAKPQERREPEKRVEDKPDTPSVQMVAPRNSIWVFTHMEPNLGNLHCQCRGSAKANRLSRVLTFYPNPPPSITDMNPRLLKQKT